MEQKDKYFSVTFTGRMGNLHLRPGVAYPITLVNEEAVLGLVKQGKAKTYPEKVRFVSGRPVPVVPQAPARAETPTLFGDGDA